MWPLPSEPPGRSDSVLCGVFADYQRQALRVSLEARRYTVYMKSQYDKKHDLPVAFNKGGKVMLRLTTTQGIYK